jgi:hypothetical protein
MLSYPFIKKGPSWPWSYGSWICNYLSNRCLLPLMLWVHISIRVSCTTLCDEVCQWLVAGFLQVRLFPPNWLPWDSWNIVESGIKHHNLNSERDTSVCYEKSQSYAKKIIFFSNFRGSALRVRPPLDLPLEWTKFYSRWQLHFLYLLSQTKFHNKV